MGRHHHTKILLALLCALALLAAACGSADDEETSEAAELTQEESAVDFDDASGGADDGFAVETDDAMEEEAMEDEAASGSAAPATTTTAPSVEQTQGGAARDGFFGEGEGDAEAEDTQANNTFADYGVRPFVATARDPLSTFALDVDTASYVIARQWADQGVYPPREAIRLEEFVNRFDYGYPAPNDGLAVVADAGPSPFNADNVIVRLGVKGEEVANADRPEASLTFVVDTSGSMDRSNRLDLVKLSLERLVFELSDDDTVALVTYSDGADVLLPPTPASDTNQIIDAIRSLRPDGSTNLEAGLQTGYDLANEAFNDTGINRVVLASDGVANVGLVDPAGLTSLIRGDADKGIQLVTVGVGMGNFNDVVLEQLANDGDGFYAYVNDEREADRLFGDELVSTLLTVAIDGKIQVEFDADNVAEYRLLGFENRAVLDDDFRNDEVDAGELGAGHEVTALYELRLNDGVSASDRLGTAQLRWQDPDSGDVVETRLELTGAILEDDWAATSDDFRLAVTVAALAEILRESPHQGEITLADVEAEAQEIADGGRADVADLVELASRLRQIR
ncbi:MAG: von Willebrand factor type A domain-containing protein [Actinomycetota bacterium]